MTATFINIRRADDLARNGLWTTSPIRKLPKYKILSDMGKLPAAVSGAVDSIVVTEFIYTRELFVTSTCSETESEVLERV